MSGPVVGCQECGNDIATVTLDDGRKVCLDCAEADAEQELEDHLTWKAYVQGRISSSPSPAHD